MKESMDLSIIIVSYNTIRLTETCLSSVIGSLSATEIKYEIIVVDNGSNDGTREMLSQKFPEVETILNDRNTGFGFANNQGIQKSNGEYILLLNSDTETLNRSIEKLYHYARQKPKAFIGGKLYNVDRTPQSSCGPFFSLPVVFASLFLKGDTVGLTRYSPNKPRYVDWVSGACIIAPKKLFLDGLMFDDKIFMYMEEMDLLYRARKKGYRTLFYPYARFIHVGTGSSKTHRKQPVLNIYRGLVFFYSKHKNPVQRIILRFLLKMKAAVAWLTGIVICNDSIAQTYAEAYKLV